MPRRILSLLTRLARRALELAAWGLELALSRRGLTLAFFLILLVFAAGAWVHPPLSRDIRGFELPLGLGRTQPTHLESILYGPTRLVLGSAGTVMIALIAVGAVIGLRRPRQLEVVTGALLCAAIALGATTLFNHPLLVERLHEEAWERTQVAALFERLDFNGMTRPSSARVRGGHGPPADDVRLSGLPFAGSWRWMIGVLLVGYLLAGRANLRYRLTGVTGWILAGCLLSTLLCGRRVYAEHLWNRGNRQEAIGELDGARRTLDRALRWSPELQDLARHRRLVGRIDYLEGLDTPDAQLFVAHRFAELGDRGAATARMRQLPLDDPVYRHQLARALVTKGRDRFFRGRLDDARIAFQEASTLTPIEYDGTFYLAVAYRQLGASPAVVEETIEPILQLSADRALRADALVVLADTLFDAGQLAEARQLYLRSLRTFDLPKEINYEAREGLLGL